MLADSGFRTISELFLPPSVVIVESRDQLPAALPVYRLEKNEPVRFVTVVLKLLKVFVCLFLPAEHGQSPVFSAAAVRRCSSARGGTDGEQLPAGDR